MNLVYFIRLLFKNVYLIFGVAFLMACLVYLVTRGQQKTYTSSTTIYTGIATGYDIESGNNSRFDLFANNARFDNLINIIKSRETQEKTAIRLMAQHLILTKPDPAFCSPETWRSLMDEAPVEIRRMAETSFQFSPGGLQIQNAASSQESDSAQVKEDPEVPKTTGRINKLQPVTGKIERSHLKSKYYTIKAGDSPSAVCQKFGISLDDLKRMNSPMPPFNGGQQLIVGTIAETYSRDNGMIREAPVGPEAEKTDAQMELPAPERLNDSSPASDTVPIRYKSDVVSNESALRYENLVKSMTEYKDADQNNYLFKTLQSSNPYYSVQKISTVKVTRIQSSDLLKLTFDSDDPAVCMQTLKIITEVFKNQYQSITKTQTGLVSDYFRERVNAAKKQLDSLEQNLLEFRMKNRIINYDEQTKFISEQKEILDKDWYEEAGKVSAARTAMSLIEVNLGEKGKSVLQNNLVLEKRQKVYELALKISMEEIKELINIDTLTLLKGQLARLKSDLDNDLMKSFDLNRSIQGLNIQNVLQKWLEKAIEVEESQARFITLTERKRAFLAKYDEFAPLGSQLKKIEREIDLAQQDYMSHLNNLNQSIMKQKNVEQSDIQIIDNPIFPIKPNASKRMIAIIVAFIAGLVITAFVIILLEFLDTSIKMPAHFEELASAKLIGAFPKIPAKPDDRINYPLISVRAIDQVVQRIRLEYLREQNRGEKPFCLFFISTREKEGKTYLATRVVEKLRASGSKVLYIKQLEKNSGDDVKRQFTSFNQPQQAWDFEYAVPDNFISIRNANELLRNYSFLTKGYHYLVFELPALLIQEFPATLAQSGSLSILVGRATRNWNRADGEAVKLYKSSIDHPVMALLNGCQADQLESIIGEIPRRRGLIRKMIKRIVNMNFKTYGTY
jgi:polysaccharide biosynthesis transport protein